MKIENLPKNRHIVGRALCELWQPHELYLKLSFQQETRAKRYQALFKYHIPEEELGRIRSATHSDMALGNERFKEEIEKLTGRRVTSMQRGRNLVFKESATF